MDDFNIYDEEIKTNNTKVPSLLLSIWVFLQLLLIPQNLDDQNNNNNKVKWAQVLIPTWIFFTCCILFWTRQCLLALKQFNSGNNDTEDINNSLSQILIKQFVIFSIIYGMPLVFFILLTIKVDNIVDISWSRVFLPLYVLSCLAMAMAAFLSYHNPKLAYLF